MLAKVLIVMGVSGSGKSTLAMALAEKHHCQFIEADEFHSDEAKKMMSRNIPLTDTIRDPWVAKLVNEVAIRQQENQRVILAYSGLKRKHRQLFRQLKCEVEFILLNTNTAVLEHRLQQRKGHFATSGLLKSQIEAMELPDENELDIKIIDADQSLAELLMFTENHLK